MHAPAEFHASFEELRHSFPMAWLAFNIAWLSLVKSLLLSTVRSYCIRSSWATIQEELEYAGMIISSETSLMILDDCKAVVLMHGTSRHLI